MEEDEDDERKSLRGELQSLSTSLGAQRAAKARAGAKMVAWEAKVEALRAHGEGDREGCAAALLEKA